MIKLTMRLQAVASLVRKGTTFADIGCDHGFLPIYLVQSNIINSAIASDINEGPLESCIKSVNEFGLNEYIKTRLSNGLENFAKGEINEIAICGMGGELISQILENCSWIKDETIHFIFNPMTHPEILRKYLYDNGFEINSDIIVKEGKHFYNVFDAQYTGHDLKCSDDFYYIGKINNFDNKEYFLHLLNYLNNRKKGGANVDEIIKIIKEKIWLL